MNLDRSPRRLQFSGELIVSIFSFALSKEGITGTSMVIMHHVPAVSARMERAALGTVGRGFRMVERANRGILGDST
eukprot:COSAG04_NODE_84_length_27625_cov_23.289835_14_plen_76_part_00